MHLSSLCSLYSPCTYDVIVVINLVFSFSAGIPGLVMELAVHPTPSWLRQMAALPESGSAGGFFPFFPVHAQNGRLDRREDSVQSVSLALCELDQFGILLN